MTYLYPLFYQSSALILFTAPPAWGKTRGLKELFQSHPDQYFLYLSPLRALSEEFKKSIKTNKSFENWLEQGGVYACTFESFSFEMVQYLDQKTIIILDEFHLLYHWGDSFRPYMQDLYRELVNNGHSILGLTATFSDDFLVRLKFEASLNFDHFYHLNIGNNRFKYEPSKIKLYFYPMAVLKELKLALESQLHETYLLFCAYRKQVKKMEQEFSNYNVLSCVGGETTEFIKKLKNNPRPQLIIATTCLSHGVNLPSISKVFLAYQVEEKDFWLQMVARGGRDGTPYELYALNDPRFSFFEQFSRKCYSLPKAKLLDWVA